ncbi:TetR/AcrR family transcriptional regulator [Desulfosporosinus fructosivorans]
MDEQNTDAKKRIMNTVTQLLLEQKDVSRITIRQIAKEANVNSALINYYFQSKENLLNMAVETCMTDIANEMFDKNSNTDDPVVRLKTMLKDISAFAFKYYFLSEIAISAELKNGSFTTTQIILPVLAEVFNEKKAESELKLIALQLIVPLQVLFLNARKYKAFLASDMFDDKQRNLVLDKMVENILK